MHSTALSKPAGRKQINDLAAESQQLHVNIVLRASPVIIFDTEQVFTAALVSSLRNPPEDVGETAGESANIWKQRANFSGTCGVYNVSVGLRATAGLHTDAHVLPLGQSPLGGEVAGYIWVNDRLIWEREKRQTSEPELWAA